MEWENIVVDEKHMSILFEFANATDAARATEPLIQKYRKELDRLERGEEDRGSRDSSWDPYSGNFRNVYAHH